MFWNSSHVQIILHLNTVLPLDDTVCQESLMTEIEDVIPPLLAIDAEVSDPSIA